MKLILSEFKKVKFTSLFASLHEYPKGLPLWLRRERICLQCRRPRFDPWVGKIPWERKWQSTPVFLPGESHEQRNLVCYSLWVHKELDMTKLQFHFFFSEFPKSATIPLIFSWIIFYQLLIGHLDSIFIFSFFILAYPFEKPYQNCLCWNVIYLYSLEWASTMICVCVCVCVCVCELSFCFDRFVTVYMLVFPEVLMFALEIREFPSKKWPASSWYIPGWSFIDVSLFRSYHFPSCGSGFILFLPPAPHAFVFHARAPWVARCHRPLHLSQLAGLRCRQPTLRASGRLLCLTSLLARLQLGGMWCLDTICWSCLVGESSGAGVSHSCARRLLILGSTAGLGGLSIFTTAVLIVGPDTSRPQMFVALVGFWSQTYFPILPQSLG